MKTLDDLLKDYPQEVSKYNMDPGKMTEHDKLLNRCKERCLYLLEQSAKTESRIREKLVKSGKYDEDIIDEAIDFLKKYDYINDLRFAQQLIKQYSGTKSLREIEQKLYQRGVEKRCIKAAISSFKENEELSGDMEMKAVKAAIRKKYKDTSCLSPDEKRKLYASLMRKGFSYRLVSKALSIDEDYD
ncbi:regulatory protein RecX [Oribacterium sp. WCC10]|uniref:regulatory protein RecX n=1 Tax=Oribacterium sp. WCC10 TaxID=1855343 RepID=UPI0008F2E6AF|nr:regulatory protein RecX [Oribacterium sp. WCC10]SFG34903.1 regulatory protein [Oribacterium sp. WCC10]